MRTENDYSKNNSTSKTRQRVVVTPTDNGKALLNPGMGWVFPYYTDNADEAYGGKLAPNDQLEWFPGCNCVYFRTGWGRIERKEGEFNWAYTDDVAERWVAKGRQIAFCWIAFSTVGSVPCTPDWVWEAGVRWWTYDGRRGPVWDDPVFVEKLGSFLGAAAERYDGKPYVSFIEIGSLGTWGEGHTYPTQAPKITFETKAKHIDLWRKYFKETPLLVNDDYGLEAVEYARTKGYGLADWSILVDNRKDSSEMAQSFWRDHPNLLECEHYHYSVQKGIWGDGGKYYKAVEDYHASFTRIHGWPYEFHYGDKKKGLEGNKDLVDRINLRIGYRLQVLKASWPREAKAGSKLRIGISWRNAGVAPCYGGGYPAISLRNSKGDVVFRCVDKGFNVRSLNVGESADKAEPVNRELEVMLSNMLPVGRYSVWVSVGTIEDQPQIALPLSEDHKERMYRLGEIEIVSD